MVGDREMPEKDGRLPEDSESLLEVMTEFAGIRLTSQNQITVQQSSVTFRIEVPLVEIDGEDDEE